MYLYLTFILLNSSFYHVPLDVIKDICSLPCSFLRSHFCSLTYLLSPAYTLSSIHCGSVVPTASGRRSLTWNDPHSFEHLFWDIHGTRSRSDLSLFTVWSICMDFTAWTNLISKFKISNAPDRWTHSIPNCHITCAYWGVILTLEEVLGLRPFELGVWIGVITMCVHHKTHDRWFSLPPLFPIIATLKLMVFFFF